MSLLHSAAAGPQCGNELPPSRGSSAAPGTSHGGTGQAREEVWRQVPTRTPSLCHGVGTPWSGHAVGHLPTPSQPRGPRCLFLSPPVASLTRFGLMLLPRFSSPWALGSVSSSLWPVTTISTTTATGELLQPWVPAGTGAAMEPHLCGPWPQAEHLSPFYWWFWYTGLGEGTGGGAGDRSS